jgi:hypothetical protein
MSMIAEFQPRFQQQGTSPSNLFAMVQGQDGDTSSSVGTAAATHNTPYEQYPDLDWKALESKNKSRQKFGLTPITPEEFAEIQVQVADLAQEQLERERQHQIRAAAMKKSESKPNFLQQLFGQVLQDTCESNYDCERPMVCCDFGVKKMCCASGLPVLNAPPQYATVPVPQGIEDDGYGYPPGRGGGGGGGGSGGDRLW